MGAAALFALIMGGIDAVFKVFGLVYWRNSVINAKVMRYRQNQDKKSFVDPFIMRRQRRARSKADKMKVKAADFGVELVRRFVMYNAFRQIVRHAVLSGPSVGKLLREQLAKKRAMRGEGRRTWAHGRS